MCEITHLFVFPSPTFFYSPTDFIFSPTDYTDLHGFFIFREFRRNIDGGLARVFSFPRILLFSQITQIYTDFFPQNLDGT